MFNIHTKKNIQYNTIYFIIITSKFTISENTSINSIITLQSVT